MNGGAPQTILPTEDRPHGIATDGTNLYWANYNAGTIRKSALDGSNPTTIGMNQSSPYALALDPTHVFWKNAGDGTVWQADLNGANPVRLGNGLATGTGGYIATGAMNVYFPDGTNGVIYDAKVGVAGTAFTPGQSGPTGIAVDSTDIFWSNATAGTIEAQALTADAGTEIVHRQGTEQAIAVVTDVWDLGAYWSDQGPAGMANSGSINKVATNGEGRHPARHGSEHPDVHRHRYDQHLLDQRQHEWRHQQDTGSLTPERGRRRPHGQYELPAARHLSVASQRYPLKQPLFWHGVRRLILTRRAAGVPRRAARMRSKTRSSSTRRRARSRRSPMNSRMMSCGPRS